MRTILQIISWVALAGTILPSVLYLADRVTLEQSQNWLLAATVVWFVATPLWMGRKPDEAA
jgi:uncharacterized membrane protein